ncbi:MAG: molecular chaperone DnaJ [Planctomycetaceae bacterium]|jgi:molecular chaperone DnaJ|nr:molecular chaperone DnaJ [Planctomycetaceae bacterium]MBT4723836.1 molecular chaperone DnaJ [Planctomycetaceae bacterium]MBT4846462.1 molecular chaperone DnaJ [Planctomycetaceae bacterium]MBT5126398.1 molecular chaperone DnaJ [Planctomycetaceae bacterium]MBT5600240.1 molecular chaperone DnaJ [Planctomycetaceae bacterium]
MAQKRDFYEVLGVARDASKSVISKAYRKLAINYHPDTNPDDEDAVSKFKQAAEAYEVLSDAEKRQRYDQYGHAGLEGMGGGAASSVEDIFEAFGDLFGGGGGIFDGIFGGGRRQNRVRRGGDIRCDVTLDLEEAATGCEQTLEVVRNEICDSCEGSGGAPGAEPEVCVRCDGIGQVIKSAGILRVQTTCPACQGQGNVISAACEECRGQGVLPQTSEITISIPAGVDDGIRVRMTGQGETSPDGGPNGDCYCFIEVRPHQVFQRHDEHLIVRLPVTYAQSVLGAEVEVPTLTGREILTIPAGTPSGETFRLRGHGVPHVRSGRPGDLLVQTYIEVPEKISDQQQLLLRDLAEMEQTEVAPQRKGWLDQLKDLFTTSDSQ